MRYLIYALLMFALTSCHLAGDRNFDSSGPKTKQQSSESNKSNSDAAADQASNNRSLTPQSQTDVDIHHHEVGQAELVYLDKRLVGGEDFPGVKVKWLKLKGHEFILTQIDNNDANLRHFKGCAACATNPQAAQPNINK